MSYGKIVILLVVITGFLCQCGVQKINQTSTDKLYKKDNNELQAKFIIYHINDTVSQLFYELSNSALIYKKTDTSQYFYSNLKLLVKTSLEDNLNTIKDTASIIIRDWQLELSVKQLKGSIFFKLNKDFNYFVDIDLFDINKKVHYSNKIYSDKTSKNSRQNFLVINSVNEICFEPYYKPEAILNLYSERNKEKLFNVDYFKTNFTLAPPPFSLEPMNRFTYKPDSVYSVYQRDEKIEIKLPQKGFYHLKTNDGLKEGVTFFVYEDSYPKLKNADQMILATRYIMSKKEFDACINSSDKKVAIDEFWLDIAGNNERARELIKRYYTRVQEANKLFTSFQEGWKTDRGMIYIVFGAPTRVTNRKNGEIWIYGESGSPSSVVFQFSKVVNPFTDNDYDLDRSDVLKLPWYQAVDLWRQGKIFLDN